MSSKQDKIDLPPDGSVQKALSAARAADMSPESYCVIGYSSPTTLCVIAQGKGGLDEVLQYLTDDDCRYILLRKDHKVEMANTVKFAFIDWTPNTMKPMRKALVSTHKHQVSAVFKPFHVDVQAGDRSGLDENDIVARIGASSGTAVHVTEKKNDDKKAAVQINAKAASLAKASNFTVTFTDLDAFKAAVKTFRDEKSNVDWVLSTYTDKEKLTLTGSGSGGVEELLTKVDDENASFGLVRVIDVIDQSKTVKFGYIKWIPDSIKPMKKAEINTRSSVIAKFFEPYHVDLHVTKKEEVTQQMIHDMVTNASGSKSRVVANNPAATKK